MSDLFPELEKLETFGKGATCSVQLWRKKSTAELYALKVVDMKKAGADRSLVRQIQREKQALDDIKSSTSSPYLVKYFGACKDQVSLYFILEFVDGGDLYKHIQSGPRNRLPEGHAKFYCAQVALAVRELHRLGYVYRDLKANNIVLSRSGNCVLLDFGRAKKISQDDNRTSSEFGIGHHAAPEIAKCKEHSFPVDIWSLGVLVIEMLLGKPPFPYVFSDSVEKERITEAICSGVDFAGLEDNPAISDAALGFINATMDLDPSKRVDSESLLLQEWFSQDLDIEGLEAGKAEPPKVLYEAEEIHIASDSTVGTKPKHDPFADW